MTFVMAEAERRVVVYFGQEAYRVDVQYDPQNPPNDDVLIDRAREHVIAEEAPSASFRKGSVID